MAIDPRAVVEEPLELALFLALILLIRGGAVFVAVRLERENGRPVFDPAESAAMACSPPPVCRSSSP